MQLSPGKQSGLQALSNPAGVIAALAIDQRSALRRLIAKVSEQHPDRVSAEQLAEFKACVSRVLTPHASAILLDPDYGLRAAAQRHSKTGLLLAYEKTGYDTSAPGRLPSLLDGFSVARLKNCGAHAVKVLLYYSPFSDAGINQQKHAWVERVGAECASADVPFFLELVSYHDDMDEKGVEFAQIKPEIVTRSIEEFCKPAYAVDVLKIGVPLNMHFVASSSSKTQGAALYSRKEALLHFRRASEAASLPFIYLSEGVSNEMFVEALAIAAEAGSAFSGVLCGRAIWQDGVAVFVRNGSAALEDWLHQYGVRNIQNVIAQLAAARPWFEKGSIVSQGE